MVRGAPPTRLVDSLKANHRYYLLGELYVNAGGVGGAVLAEIQGHRSAKSGL